MAYPVVTEASLPPVERVRFRRARRDRHDLPALTPGCGYVFRTPDGLVAWGDRHVDPTDRIVVDATEVSVVQLRPRLVTVDVPVKPRAIVRVGFRCRVLRPEEVVAAYLVDLDELLADEVREALLAEAEDFDIEDFGIEAKVWAYWAVTAPEIPGMAVVLASVDVLPPAGSTIDAQYDDQALLAWEERT